jgi:hypothetical protein
MLYKTSLVIVINRIYFSEFKFSYCHLLLWDESFYIERMTSLHEPPLPLDSVKRNDVVHLYCY